MLPLVFGFTELSSYVACYVQSTYEKYQQEMGQLRIENREKIIIGGMHKHQLSGPDVRRCRFIVMAPSATLGGRVAEITPLVKPVKSEPD